MSLFAMQWELCVWQDELVPGWLQWMYAVVVVGSLAASLLLFAILLSWYAIASLAMHPCLSQHLSMRPAYGSAYSLLHR